MSKVTSKLQVTIPKRLAEQYCIGPGDSISFEAAGEVIRVLPPVAQTPAGLDRHQRLALFDAGTRRQRAREARAGRIPAKGRGWTREELYQRGNAD